LNVQDLLFSEEFNVGYFQVTINARVVVVGASDVGIAFLETFAFWFVAIHFEINLL
jgi:hypothetical protein